MSEPPLLLECLRIVLDILLVDNVDKHSLATLLRVNRFFAEATLPFLYADPFCDDFHRQYDTAQRDRYRLAQTLLRQAPAENVTYMLRAIFSNPQGLDGHLDPFPDELDPYVPVLHYLPHIKTLSPNTYPTALHFNKYRKVFLEAFGLERRYLSLAPNFDGPADELFHNTYMRDVVNDHMTLAFCSPLTIQTMTIPMIDCKRYLSRVEQFRTLANVEFCVTTLLPHRNIPIPPLSPTTDTTDREQRVRQELAEHMEAMVAFVQKHTQIHRDVLRTAKCQSPSYVYREVQPKIEACQQQILGFLPPLWNPTHLDWRNLRQFCLRPNEAMLDFVEQISTSCSLDSLDKRKRTLEVLAPHFPRCRALKRIFLDLYDDDIFRWAAEEKKQYDLLSSRGETPSKRLVPVEFAELRFRTPGFGSQIDSFMQGFGDTLQMLNVRGRQYQ